MALETALEAAHERLRRAALTLEEASPVTDLSLVASAVTEALLAVHDAFDGRRDLALAIHTARERALAATDPLADDGETYAVALRAHLERAVEHLDRAADLAPNEAPAPLPDPPDMLASIGVPRLHALLRPSLPQRLNVPKARALPRAKPELPHPPPPRPRTFDELAGSIAALKARAAAIKPRSPSPSSLRPAPKASPPARAPSPPGFVKALPSAVSEAAFVRDKARELFEEVVMAGIQRAPLAGEPWRSVRLIEQRMLTALDAIVAMGHEALAQLPSFVTGAPVRDPSRSFALGVVLGSVQGRDALALVEYALLSCAHDIESANAVGDALALVPHPHCALALRTLQKDLAPAARAVAIEALARRGLATAEDLMAAANDEPLVAARALVPLACHRERPSISSLLAAALQSEDAALRAAALTAAVLSGDSLSRDRVMESMHEPSAATALAITGDQRLVAARALVERARKAPSPAVLDALGWLGAGSVTPILLASLDSPEEAVRAAAGKALERITGAGLVERVEVSDDAITVADPPEPDVGEPKKPKILLASSDPRDMPEPPAPEFAARPSTDPALWSAYLRERAFELNQRYRRGRPHSPAVVLAELDGPTASPGERAWLVRELFACTGHPIRLDPRDWVVAQEQAIAAYAAVASQAKPSPRR